MFVCVCACGDGRVCVHVGVHVREREERKDTERGGVIRGVWGSVGTTGNGLFGAWETELFCARDII